MRSLLTFLTVAGLVLGLSGCSFAKPDALTPSTAAMQTVQHRQSWMSHEATGEDLLYVVDSGLGSLDLYSYTPPNYKLVGLIANPTGFSFLCVNKAQDIFVTQPYSLIEYKHGVPSPLRVLGNLKSAPYGCAIDPTTGTLAVPNETTTTSYVSFFKKGRGTYTSLEVPTPYILRFYAAYDDDGDLFVTSVKKSYPNFALLELPKNSKTFVEIAIDQTLTDGLSGGMMWDGKYLDMADYEKNVIYQFAIHGKKASTHATINLRRSYNIGGFFLEGSTLIAPASSKLHQPSQSAPAIVNMYDYPAGGKKTGVIRGVSYATNVVVSLAKRQK
jgi:DNA-binding beta-propeller fold protein YncE